MDTKTAILFTNVPGRQKRFTIETPSGDVVMVCYSLERRHFKVGTSFWPTHRPKFLEMLELIYDVESISRMKDCEDAAVIQVLRYAETNYREGSFSEIAEQLHYDPSWLSREVKRRTGKTYTQILQEKRLAQAAFLLKNTNRSVADISAAVGYENVSYFHRIFAAAYGKSPKHYRDGLQLQEKTLF